MIEYLTKAWATFLIGFVPVAEIYVAVPAGMAMGLDPDLGSGVERCRELGSNSSAAPNVRPVAHSAPFGKVTRTIVVGACSRTSGARWLVVLLADYADDRYMGDRRNGEGSESTRDQVYCPILHKRANFWNCNCGSTRDGHQVGELSRLAIQR